MDPDDASEPSDYSDETDLGSVYDNAEDDLRLAIDSLKPFLALFKFVPSRAIPFLQLQPGCGKFPMPEDLRKILAMESEDDKEGASLLFFKAMLQDTAPPGVLTHFMQSLLLSNRDHNKVDAAPWRVHDIITMSRVYMPLQLSLLRLLGEENHEDESPVHIKTLASKLCQVRQITLEHLTRVYETLETDGHRAAAIKMLIFLYSNTVEGLCEITRDRLLAGIHPKVEGLPQGPPEWVPKLVELLEQQAGPEAKQFIPQEVVSSQTWQSARDLLSFRKSLKTADTTDDDASEAGESMASDVTVTERARDKGREPVDDEDASSEWEIKLPEGPPVHETRKGRIMEYLNIFAEPTNQTPRNFDCIIHAAFNEPETDEEEESPQPSDMDDSSSVFTSVSSGSTDNNEDANDIRRLATHLRFTALSNNPMQITLHAYQEELLREAREGKNVLILLPTGTGKTFIVMKYTEEILAKPRLSRVAFLAPKVKLVEQQFMRFRQLLPKVTYLRCGISRSSSAPFSELLKTYRVFVMTPQCLVEAIHSKEVKITDFSLLILDECHRTSGGHSFKMVMDMYMDAKLGENSDSVRVPQVIGLTASPGVGKGGSVEAAMSHLKELCYSLDVETICTVKENVEELKKYINEPQHEIHGCPRRKKDKFKKIMESMMLDIETKMTTCSYIENCSDEINQGYLRNVLTSPAQHRGQKIYSNWVFNVSSHLANMEHDEEDTYTILFSYAEMLQRYQRALILNEDCESHYALDYLKEQFDFMRDSTPAIGQTDRELLQDYDRNLHALESACNDAEDYNPKLRMLEDILLGILENEQDEEAACMVFVRTLELSKAIQRWIQNHPQLSKLNPGRITGLRISSKPGGMSRSEVSDAMAKFNSGECKIVVCTSAAEEGLDFQACNVVVRYDYVTNMIAMIQTRGRARRKDSQYLVLGELSQGNLSREQENLANERLMKQAIDKLQNEMETNPNAFRERLFQWQKQEFSRRRDEEEIALRRQSIAIANTSRYDLLCRKCRTVACSSTDFRLLGNSSRIVMNKAFEQKMTIVRFTERKPFTMHMEKVAKIYCKSKYGCHYDWGIIANHIPSGREFPVLKLEHFFLRDTGTKQIAKGRIKWKDCPFYVHAVTDEELMSL